MRLPFYTLDVFTDRAFGGNPRAVFPEADGISGEKMQALTHEMNLSETTFIQQPRWPGPVTRERTCWLGTRSDRRRTNL